MAETAKPIQVKLVLLGKSLFNPQSSGNEVPFLHPARESRRPRHTPSSALLPISRPITPPLDLFLSLCLRVVVRLAYNQADPILVPSSGRMILTPCRRSRRREILGRPPVRQRRFQREQFTYHRGRFLDAE